MSSTAAWAAYAKRAGAADPAIHPYVQVRGGRLSLPAGQLDPSGSTNEDVWAYSWPACPVNTLDPENKSGTPCVQWLFLDAFTGAGVDETWQQTP
jgi:hypothetical protein